MFSELLRKMEARLARLPARPSVTGALREAVVVLRPRRAVVDVDRTAARLGRVRVERVHAVGLGPDLAVPALAVAEPAHARVTRRPDRNDKQGSGG